eukprot:TRINITY_DN2282_c1_g1_i1.p1 TRINITY_DN2282_c1_g1~~TRINITY_DN2282_c1_g1_i1.p1  ORF type:complete len:321 (+),score=10.53 TRINITY_DN2282_c1_g1_i1:86-1048(+)
MSIRFRVRGEPTAQKNTGHLKGMDNQFDAYHCFLNVCLQGCLHLRALREVIIETGHSCTGKECVLCEVRFVVQSAPRVTASYLSPELVRTALENKVGSNIRPHEMSDAVEVFWALCSEMQKTLPEKALDGIFPESAYILTALQSITAQNLSFVIASNVQEGYPLARHSLFPVQVVWKNYPPQSTQLQTDLVSFASVMHAQLDLRVISPHLYPRPHSASLKGFIAYYPGMHYTAVFRLESGVWVHFDDKLIREISVQWKDVMGFISRGKHMPVLLFYEADEVDSDLEEWVDVAAPVRAKVVGTPSEQDDACTKSPKSCVVS